MNLPAKMAWRYLFARKSTNAINIITLIAAFGIAIGAAALLLLLSVFNGFEDLFLEMFNNLNPDVRIEANTGKTFVADPAMMEDLLTVDGVELVSQTLEETAIFSYNDKKNAASVKGVDEFYAGVTGIDTVVHDGEYQLAVRSARGGGAVVGTELSIMLGIDPLNKFEKLTIFTLRPKPRGGNQLITGRGNYLRRDFQPTGVIRSREAFGNQAVLIGLEQARSLLSADSNTVSALEIKLDADASAKRTYNRIQAVMGEDYTVKNRYQQENSILKLMQVEKWIGFAIVSLMMILISFNLIGALWMIVLEKRPDISILRSLGMTARGVSSVFLRVGLLLCGIGLMAGFTLATALFLLQKIFGLVTLPGSMTEAYPISFRWYDFPIVALTVLVIGLIASLLPAQRAGKVEAVN